MDRNRKQQITVAVLLVMAIVAAVLLRPKPRDTEPNDPDYYTGPRRSKSDPNVWVTAEGKIVPPPADAKPLTPAETGKQKTGGE